MKRLATFVASIIAAQIISLVVLSSNFPCPPSHFRAIFEETLTPLLPLARKNGRFKLGVFRHKWLYWPLTRARRLMLTRNRKMASWLGLSQFAGPIVAYVDIETGASVHIPMADLPPKSEGRVRYVAISDTHLLHSDVKLPASGDVLIHCGDIFVEDRGGINDVNGRWQTLLDDFNIWLGKQADTFEHRLVTGGNHDKILEELGESSVQDRLHNGTYVSGGAATIKVGAAKPHLVYLSAASRRYGDNGGNFAFQYSTDQAAEEMWSEVPSAGKVDVLVTHGPPLGMLDGPSKNAGCPVLLRHVKERIRPRVHVFGHWHANPGSERVGDTVFVNAATIDFDYAITNPPVVFDL